MQFHWLTAVCGEVRTSLAEGNVSRSSAASIWLTGCHVVLWYILPNISRMLWRCVIFYSFHFAHLPKTIPPPPTGVCRAVYSCNRSMKWSATGSELLKHRHLSLFSIDFDPPAACFLILVMASCSVIFFHNTAKSVRESENKISENVYICTQRNTVTAWPTVILLK